MKYRLLTLVFSVITLSLALALVSLPPGIAGALQNATPTPYSGFVIATSTPAGGTTDGGGGGLLIPTATPSGGGGFTIATSTPSSGPTGPGLPQLSEEQLKSLLLQPEDVPVEFIASPDATTTILADVVTQLNDSGATDFANVVQHLIDAYGWTAMYDVTYDACVQNIPVEEIYSAVGQTSSPEAARALLEDQQFLGMVQQDGSILEPATNVHGYLHRNEDAAAICLEDGIEYGLNFEYWGLLITVSMIADANTDPAMIQGLLDQLAAIVISKVDQLAGTPFPPTPTPGAASVVVAPTATQGGFLLPTQASQPTQAPLPTQALVPQGPTLADVDAVMPTTEELGLQGYVVDQQLSQAFTVQSLAAYLTSVNLADLANVITQLSGQYGLLGQATRGWSAADTCPVQGALSLEIDVAVFTSDQSPAAYMLAPQLLQEYQALGIQTQQTTDNGLLSVFSYAHPQCGAVTIYTKSITFGHMLISTGATTYSNATQQEVVSVLDLSNQFVVQKLQAAGLQ